MRLPGIAGVKDLNTNRATGHRTARPRVPSDENGRSSGATGGLTRCVPLQLPRAWGATCPRNAVEPMWLMELSSGWLYRKICHLLPGYSKDPHLGRIARGRGKAVRRLLAHLERRAGRCRGRPGSIRALRPAGSASGRGPAAVFAAFSNTWRRVNSWKNRSPTG
jgi:hypothetical protein